MLPVLNGRGQPLGDHRQVVEGVLWRLRTGAPWRDLPERYGPWQTLYERFARRESDGTRARLDDLRRPRNACAHPRLGPRSQKDLDKALATAYQTIAQLRR